jgi:type VI protein secretion system component Hcp
MGLATALLIGAGWTAAHAQILSGSTIFFGIPLTGSGASSSSLAQDASSSPETRFFQNVSSASSVATQGTAAQPYPIGMNLRLEDFPTQGQSVDIPLQSYHWNEAQPTTTQKRATLHGFSVVMKENLATPRLFIVAANGDRLPRATVTLRQGGTDQDHVRWTLTNVKIESFQTVASLEDTIPTDTLELSFDTIEVQLTPIFGNGAVGTPVRAGWDVKTGQMF